MLNTILSFSFCAFLGSKLWGICWVAASRVCLAADTFRQEPSSQQSWQQPGLGERLFAWFLFFLCLFIFFLNLWKVLKASQVQSWVLVTFVDIKVQGFFRWDVLGAEGSVSSKGVISIQGCKWVCLSFFRLQCFRSQSLFYREQGGKESWLQEFILCSVSVLIPHR